MDPLKQLFTEKSQALGKEIKDILKEHGDKQDDQPLQHGGRAVKSGKTRILPEPRSANPAAPAVPRIR